MRIDWAWGGLGVVGVVGLVVFLLFWALVITALVLAIRWLVRSDQRSRYDGSPPWPHRPPPSGWAPPGGVPPSAEPGHGTGPIPGATPTIGLPLAAPEPDALEVLRLRYARGEIDEAEYERRRSFLLGSGGGAAGPGGPPRG